jgi:hypothetical protein
LGGPAAIGGLERVRQIAAAEWNGYFDQGLGQPKIGGVVAGSVPGDGTLLAQQSRLFRVPTVLVEGLSGR